MEAETRRKHEHEAWCRYERRWREIKSESVRATPLRFARVPWPMVDEPRGVDDITESSVREFIISPEHPEGASRRDRIRAALRRWHPDKFGRHLAKVLPSERRPVEEAVGTVVRVLNALAAEEGH
ncbi:hypothetical protein K488DRAFT_58735 [Vararia minispora EC-137]|uniref:Uncharacterized protein n=1 Tax=Vararia minispora EC-137 TaxID=1314806 RepID=A0ACB8Q9N5_9AGAM|nr:hypothetical protein K488DRAFT_58735 [Vararia minispora EC-137]